MPRFVTPLSLRSVGYRPFGRAISHPTYYVIALLKRGSRSSRRNFTNGVSREISARRLARPQYH